MLHVANIKNEYKKYFNIDNVTAKDNNEEDIENG